MKYEDVLKILKELSATHKSRMYYKLDKTINAGCEGEGLYLQVKINTFYTKATLETFDINDDFINSIKLLLNDNTCSNLQSC